MNRATLATIALLCFAPRGTADESVIVPSGHATSPGDSANRAPFGVMPNETVPRYQQIYGAPALSGLVGQSITGIAFRVNESAPLDGDVSGGFAYPQIRIELSISPMGVDGLSTNFDANVGPNPVTVFDGGFTLPNLEGDFEVNPLELVFDFTTPFAYAGGDLLIDVTVASANMPVFYLDAVWQGGMPLDQTSRALDHSIQGLITDTVGIVTEFRTAATPGITYCEATPNSSGAVARISAGGSTSLAANDLVLTTQTLPIGRNATMFNAASRNETPFGNGNLCLGTPMLRFTPMLPTPGGALIQNVDYAAAPHLAAGSTWSFQTLFRDPAAGGGLVDASNGLTLTFVP